MFFLLEFPNDLVKVVDLLVAIDASEWFAAFVFFFLLLSWRTIFA